MAPSLPSKMSLAMRFLPVILLGCVCAAAQSGSVIPNPGDASALHKGVNEWGVQTGGGTAIAGGAQDRSFWMLAGRWSRILTGELGGGPLRGNLQYGLEVIPALVMSQSTTVYAGGVTPVLMRYNFTAHRRFVPYLEAGAGILGSSDPLPEATSRFNFTPQGGIGFQIMQPGARAIQMGVRYHHISNAGLARRNPGINSLYFFTGISWWR